MKAKITVYMNQRDVTPWVTAITFTQQANSYYRSAKVTFAGFNAIDEGATWDIFGTYDPTVPRSQVLIYQGAIPPEQPATFTLDAAAGPTVDVTINDWAWFAQRCMPKHSLVICKTVDEAIKTVEKTIPSSTPNRYQYAVGSWRWVQAGTFKQAATALANLSQFNITINTPDYDLQPYVVQPTKSTWDAILELAQPFVPEVFFRRTECRVILADRLQRFQGVGSQLVLSAKAIAGPLVATPRIVDYTRRVLLQVPQWA